MRIYTYYENIGFKKQDELIELWKQSWQKNGFEPIVLSKNNAQQNGFYETFVEELNKIYNTVVGKKIDDYSLSCFLRWLAYSTQKDERVYFSDYDIINNGFNLDLFDPVVDDKLHFMDDCCPCFGTGSPFEFDQFAKLIIELSYKNIENISSRKISSYHDQDFLVNSRDDILSTNWIKLSRNRKKYCESYNYEKENNCFVVHFNHNRMFEIKNNFYKAQPDICLEEIRILSIKKLICHS